MMDGCIMRVFFLFHIKYVNNLIKKFRMMKHKNIATLMDFCMALIKDEVKNVVIINMHRQLVGIVLYINITISSICYWHKLIYMLELKINY